MSDDSNSSESLRVTIQIIRDNKPEDVRQLIVLLKNKLNFTEDQAMNTILNLKREGKIRLETQPISLSPAPTSLSKNKLPLWYWVSLVIAVATVLAVFAVPENLQPWIYLRNVLGLFFVLLLPGYTLIKLLFPVNVPFKMPSENLDTVERIAMSIVMSIAIVSLVGLLLSYTTYGIRFQPIVLTLFALTSIFATIAMIRENKMKTTARTQIENYPLT